MDNNSFDVSEGSPILQELHDFVDGIDNIDEFVKQDIPDVLMGVMGSDETPSPELQELQRCLSPDASELLQPPGCPPPLLNLQTLHTGSRSHPQSETAVGPNRAGRISRNG